MSKAFGINLNTSPFSWLVFLLPDCKFVFAPVCVIILQRRCNMRYKRGFFHLGVGGDTV